MASRFKYNPATNRWEKDEVPVPKGKDVSAGTGQPWTWSDIPTTTTAPKPKTPKTQTTPKPTGTKQRVTSNIPSKPTTPRTEPTAPINVPKPKDTVVQDYLKTIIDDPNGLLATLLLGGSSGGGGGSAQPTTAQRVAAAKKYGRQNMALAKKFYGQQQQQGQQAIDAATAELLANMKAPAAYTNLPLVSVPPAMQGLQQNLLTYGGTGEQAAGQQAQDLQAADMYTALARRGAEQLGQAETGYFDALKRAALQAQTAGRQGLTQNVADLQNQVLLQNLQAIMNAQQ